jgi:hypothetical protein
MSDDSAKKQLGKLRLKRDAKFEEIVSYLDRKLYPSLTCTAGREHLIEEAEELTDQWAVAEDSNRLPELNTSLRILLSQHQEICKRIIELIDSGGETDDR